MYFLPSADIYCVAKQVAAFGSTMSDEVSSQQNMKEKKMGRKEKKQQKVDYYSIITLWYICDLSILFNSQT